MYHATFKDCMYGQVRCVNDLWKVNHTSIKHSPAMNVIKQDGITWNNDTGMNPLWKVSPTQHTIYDEYSNIFIKGHITIPNTYFAKYSSPGLSNTEYTLKCVANNYNNPYAMICKSMGIWYLIDKMLLLPDALEYDYTIFRQYDTYLNINITDNDMKIMFDNYEHELFNAEHDASYIPHKWPLMFVHGAVHDDYGNFNNISNVYATYFILNRAAIKVLQGKLFQLIVDEVNFLDNAHGTYNKFVLGWAGTLLHHIAVKNNIYQIDIAKHRPWGIKRIDAIGFDRLERGME